MTDREIQRKNFEKDIFGSKIEVDLELYLKLELLALKPALEQYRKLPSIPLSMKLSHPLVQERLDQEKQLGSFALTVRQRVKSALEKATVKIYDQDQVRKTINDLQCCLAEIYVMGSFNVRFEGAMK